MAIIPGFDDDELITFTGWHEFIKEEDKKNETMEEIIERLKNANHIAVGMEPHIKAIVDKSKEIMDRCKMDNDKAKSVIEAMQNICPHLYETAEQTPHYTIERCNICGHEWRI